MRLEGDKGGLEVGADTQAGDDLEDDDARPRGRAGEGDVEPETQRHEKGAEPDYGPVPPGLADPHPREGGHEGEREDVGE